MKPSPLKALIWAALSSLTPLADCTKIHGVTDTPEDWLNPSVLYRGDGRNPETIARNGGFLTRKPKPDYDAAYSLQNHVHDWWQFKEQRRLHEFDTRYISASTSYAATAKFIERKEDPYIYMVQPTPNAIDVNGSYKKKGITQPNAEEREYAFLEGIVWSQVKAYKRPNDKQWTPNPAYNPEFDKFTHGGARPELVERSNNRIRDQALAILSNNENRRAKELNAAPSFCYPGPVKRGVGSCTPRYSTAPVDGSQHFGGFIGRMRRTDPDGKPLSAARLAPDGKPISPAPASNGRVGPDGKPISPVHASNGRVDPDGKPISPARESNGRVGPDGKPLPPARENKNRVGPDGKPLRTTPQTPNRKQPPTAPSRNAGSRSPGSPPIKSGANRRPRAVAG